MAEDCETDKGCAPSTGVSCNASAECGTESAVEESTESIADGFLLILSTPVVGTSLSRISFYKMNTIENLIEMNKIENVNEEI